MKKFKGIILLLLMSFGLFILIGCSKEEVDTSEVFIKSIVFNEKSELIVEYLNGKTEVLVGLDNNKKVKTVVLNDKGEVEVYYLDDSSKNLGINPEYFLVQFKDYNGYVIDVQNVLKGESPNKPKAPEREGYEFIGWDRPFEEIHTELEIYAVYSNEPELGYYLVQFKDYNGYLLDIQYVLSGKSAKTPKSPTRKGYEFLGWDKNYFKITENLEVIALYKEVEFTIKFESNGGTKFDDIGGISYGDTVYVEAPTRIDYSFEGWYLDEEFNEPFISGNLVYKSFTLYAKWKPIKTTEEIVIMHGAVHEIDPFHINFSGSDAAARRAEHEKIEEELNVKIVYKEYPAAAPWGPGRVESIIRWHQSGKPAADIYWITTQWLSEIAEANAIAPITNKWLNDYGRNIDDTLLEAGKFQNNFYSFGPDQLNGEKGLFYNTELLENWELEDPVELWNKGQWTWEKFEELTVAAKAKTKEGQAVLGGMPSVYAESLIPLNGGSIVSLDKGVGMDATPAIQTYEYLNKLYNQQLFETSPTFDSGSEAWQGGNVLFHPGNLWFVKASNRWGNSEFVKQGNIGVVPFPLPAGKTKDDYVIPLGGEAVYTVASNLTNPSKEELAFEVWNRIQIWKTDEEHEEIMRVNLNNIFDYKKYVDVYIEIYDKVYFDIHADLGIGTYSTGSWQSNVNAGFRDGSYRTKVMAIKDSYQEAYNKYLGNY